MVSKGLSVTTAKQPRGDIDFYINEHLLYEGPTHASEKLNEVGIFLVYWFIRVAMWASEGSIKNQCNKFEEVLPLHEGTRRSRSGGSQRYERMD